MKFQKAIDIWKLNPAQRAKLQAGQWIYAGNPNSKGVWCGQKANGVDVAAWYHNAKGRTSYHQYIRDLIKYAKTV